MYLLDTNVISELRKKAKANKGVKSFFTQVNKDKSPLYMSVITIGELRRGVELIRHRGDEQQAAVLESWLGTLVVSYKNNILDFSETESQIWGRLRVPNHENAIDKQIAATALTYDLCVVTRNENDFRGTGVRVLNPFSSL
ncbi:MAG: VapC toxin family PIN domain ribonuclease [Alteromonadaceae bacterium]|nr:MAG: VapC toxin family PIN domain ribonuclease [Alteromonadaceae bacterium]